MGNTSGSFTAPPRDTKTVERKDVIARMNAAPKHHILYMHAPAGYGKTTAAVQWLGGRRAAWLSPGRFTQASAEVLLDFINIPGEWPEAFVIDNFHHYTDPSAASALRLIRARIPAGVYLLVLSRARPPEGLAGQAVTQITGLGFRPDEVASLFSKKGIFITNYAADLLCRQTEGWAAALAAVLRSGFDICSGVRRMEPLNRYIRAVLSDAAYDGDLKKCAFLEPLNRDLLIAVTENHTIWEVVTELSAKTGLVTVTEDGSAVFHALLREYLETELRRDKQIDMSLLYKKAAVWYGENGRRLRAFAMAFKSGDIRVMEEICRVKPRNPPGAAVSVSEYARLMEESYLTIPASIAEQYPGLSAECFNAAFLIRPLREANRWADVVREHIQKGALSREESAFTLSITYNFPFFHRAQRDYTDIAPKLSKTIARIQKQMPPVLSSLSNPLVSLIKAGVLYECGRPDEAEAITGELMKESGALPPEVRFCLYALVIEIRRVFGGAFEPEQIGLMIERTGSDYLVDNYRAFMINLRLYNGDTEAAAVWLERVKPGGTPRLHSVTGDFVTAKALLSSGKLPAAENLLERLVSFSLEYNRSADYIEALTLLSVSKWQRKRKSEAVFAIIPALVKAAELRLVMPIAKEGRDILPILQRVVNRAKYGYGAKGLDMPFISLLQRRAQDAAARLPGLFAQNKNRTVSLSPRQTEVLGHLSRNRGYKEIAAFMNITTATVDDHMRKLREKLNASSTNELLRKARELTYL